jgi:hypothetical protein
LSRELPLAAYVRLENNQQSSRFQAINKTSAKPHRA